jgi:hypothetical protein
MRLGPCMQYYIATLLGLAQINRVTISNTDGRCLQRRRCWSGSTAGVDNQANMQGRLLGRAGRPVDSSCQAEEQPSGAQGSPAAFSLALPSPPLTVNASRGRFPARRAYLGHSSRARGGRAVDSHRPRSFSRPSPAARTRGQFRALPPLISIRCPWRSCRHPSDAFLRLGDAKFD